MEEQIQDASNINLVAVALLVVLACLTWLLPRRLAACPILIMTCLLPLGQHFVLLGLHFQFFRILLLVGAVRVIAKGEFAQMTWTRADKVFAWWALVSVVFGALSKPSTELLANRLGDFYNAIGGYFVFRCLVVDLEDIVVGARTLALLCLPLAVLMLVEKITTHNLLSIFGGVPEITAIRDGHLRCQAAFRHPILAGTFGATQLPLFVALWFYDARHRLLALLAIVSTLIIVIAASSSGALMALFAGLGGLALWKYHAHMRLFRWGAIITIFALVLIMNAPVWYLFARLSDLTGGTGWHRAYVIDTTIAHFDEWWLFGTTYTAHWGPGGQVIAADPNMMDITNHFVMEGVKGGVLKLVLFIVLIVGCFKIVGNRLRLETEQPAAGFFIWALGTSLSAHCLSFLSITYFDQSIIIWYWLLAVISSLACLRFTESVGEPAPEESFATTPEQVDLGAVS